MLEHMELLALAAGGDHHSQLTEEIRSANRQLHAVALCGIDLSE